MVKHNQNWEFTGGSKCRGLEESFLVKKLKKKNLGRFNTPIPPIKTKFDKTNRIKGMMIKKRLIVNIFAPMYSLAMFRSGKIYHSYITMGFINPACSHVVKCRLFRSNILP